MEEKCCWFFQDKLQGARITFSSLSFFQQINNFSCFLSMLVAHDTNGAFLNEKKKGVEEVTLLKGVVVDLG